MAAPRERYRLLAADGSTFESRAPGSLGGNRRLRIYGRLDCPSAGRALKRGYSRWRVFFLDEAAAVAAGYRPCGVCMRDRYRQWRLFETRPTAYDPLEAGMSFSRFSRRPVAAAAVLAIGVAGCSARAAGPGIDEG